MSTLLLQAHAGRSGETLCVTLPREIRGDRSPQTGAPWGTNPVPSTFRGNAPTGDITTIYRGTIGALSPYAGPVIVHDMLYHADQGIGYATVWFSVWLLCGITIL